MERKERCQEWPSTAPLPALRLASQQPWLLPLHPVCCLPGELGLKGKKKVLSFSLAHNGIFMAGLGRPLVVECSSGPVFPHVSFQSAKVPPLKGAKVGVTAPNRSPSDLFLPIRCFSPVSRPGWG